MAIAPVPVRELGYAQGQSGWWVLADEEPTPELRWPHSVQVFDAMRRQDAQVASVLRAVTMPVRRTTWRLDPAGARDEVTEQVADDLGLAIRGAEPVIAPRTADRFSWPEHLRLALLMLAFGHSFFEQLYRYDETSRRHRLRKLGWRPPRSIAKVNVAPDGGLESIEQHALPGIALVRSGGVLGPRTVTIPVSRLVAYVHDREGGNWLGSSLLRPAYKHHLLKDRLLRIQTQTIERNGMGVPLYKDHPGGDETTIAKGLAMAQGWRSGEASGGAVADGADMLLRGVEGDLPDANPAIRYHDEQIARAVLAHFLNLGTQTGSWALASVQADTFVQSLQGVAEQIADVATQHVVEDIVDVNFGPDEPAPRIVFDEIGSRQQATAQAIKMLTDAGVLLPNRELEEAVRQQFGLPPKGTPPAPQTDAGGGT